MRDVTVFPQPLTIVLGNIAHCLDNPHTSNNALVFERDGALAFNAKGIGCVVPKKLVTEFCHRQPNAKIVDHSGCWVIPGLIDIHTHGPQIRLLASSGEILTDWLKKYVFPEEARFERSGYAVEQTNLFFRRLVASGTTTVMVFGSQYEEATRVAFQMAEKYRLRAYIGLNLSDMLVPTPLRTTPSQALERSYRLIDRWHRKGNGKLRWVVTPRFALAASQAMLHVCGEILKAGEGAFLFQTHLNEESTHEIPATLVAHPGHEHYLDIYDRHGLVGERSVFAHSVHSTEPELRRLAEAGSSVAYCPSSNAMLGSGLMPLRRHIAAGINVGFGTDVGAGLGPSLLKESAWGYALQMLHSQSSPADKMALTGAQLLYGSTLAGAKALGCAEEVGNFAEGKAADIVVLDPRLDKEVQYSLEAVRGDDSAELTKLMILGSQQIVRKVYIDGICAFDADAPVKN